VAAALNRIQVERESATAAIVRLGGEHDLSSAAQLVQVFEELIAEQRAVVVDLARATFVDSSILAALLEARERSAEAGLELRLSMPDATAPAVRRVVELTGLSDAVTTEEPREVATESPEPAP
jgi:anti-sigma B factor antagonist